jgi:hypothetical protein
MLGGALRHERSRSLRRADNSEEVRLRRMWLFLGLGVLDVLGSVVVVLVVV